MPLLLQMLAGVRSMCLAYISCIQFVPASELTFLKSRHAVLIILDDHAEPML